MFPGQIQLVSGLCLSWYHNWGQTELTTEVSCIVIPCLRPDVQRGVLASTDRVIQKMFVGRDVVDEFSWLRRDGGQ